MESTEKPEKSEKTEVTGRVEVTDDRWYQLYLQQRQTFTDGARESYQRFDQIIVAVSGGSIVLSIGFSKDIGHATQSLP